MKRLGLTLIGVLLAFNVQAELSTMAGTISNPNRALTVTARLDFNINIDKFIYFRIGGGSAFPNTSSTIDTVNLNTAFALPTTTSNVTASNGNNKTINWIGSAPTLSSTNTVSLPVQVRSNAGQVSLWAEVLTPLSNGTNNLPFSSVKISSSAPTNLPAPLIPDSGQGSSVLVKPTGFSNLVTAQDANWTFSYNSVQGSAAGVYAGELAFTAAAP